MANRRKNKNPTLPIPAQPHASSQKAINLRAEQFIGPLPPPAILEEYDRIHPGAAQIILERFVEQKRKRIKSCSNGSFQIVSFFVHHPRTQNDPLPELR
jgi:uncharacterized membrane protein